ncbi:MAG: hypothetical protein H0X63_01065 [Flavobacteriales bacterium]|nr:hypothetical protein [Flavobacteriales bacterium]
MQIKALFIILGCIFLFAGCTRDDICTPDTSKTPLLIIRFYNANAPDLFKPAPRFTVFQEGDEFTFFAPETTDSIAIPLPTNSDFADYFFVTNATDSIPNIDLISFTYIRKNEFINRACAFRTNYNNFNGTLDNNFPMGWIENIQIVTDSINARNQNAAHINIYH